MRFRGREGRGFGIRRAWVEWLRLANTSAVRNRYFVLVLKEESELSAPHLGIGILLSPSWYLTILLDNHVLSDAHVTLFKLYNTCDAGDIYGEVGHQC